MRVLALTLTLAGLSAAATCPTYVARNEAYPVGTIVTYNGANYKVVNSMNNGWTNPNNNYFWNATTEDCAPVVPQATNNEVMEKLNALDAKLDLILAKLPNQFVDTRDGKTYGYVKIGTQTWMSQNLNFATATGSWCYGDNEANCATYGRLYNWATAKDVCPTGWRLPSSSDWEALNSSISATASAPTFSQAVTVRPDGTDEFGLGVKFGGYKNGNGGYSRMDTTTYYWTSTQVGPLYRARWINKRSVEFGNQDASSANGMNIRCIK